MTSQQTLDDLQYQKTQLVKQIHETERQKPTQPRSLPISIGRGIGE